jgi:predicted SnoaL-like aldol condensation-catalyzing enzyme
VVTETEANKRTVREFLDLAFNGRRPEEAAERHMGSTYTQHNPAAGDGRDAFIEFATGLNAQFPELQLEFKRLIAEGDFVCVHAHGKMTPDDRGVAAMDIFRLEDGKVVEHWDVSQPVPEESANSNGMF